LDVALSDAGKMSRPPGCEWLPFLYRWTFSFSLPLDNEMLRTKFSCLLILVPLGVASCSSGPTGPPTPKTSKVGGVFKINGEPAPIGEVELKLYAKGRDVTQGEVVANCIVGEGGKYAFNSYRQGDGAVPGEYVLSAEWLRPAPGVMYGPDKFLNNFNSPSNADPRFQVTVVDEGSVEIPTIDIKTSELRPQKSHPFASPSGKEKKNVKRPSAAGK
jgi:hypothetical protein